MDSLQAGVLTLLNKLELEFMFVLLQIIVTSQNIVLKPGVAVHSCDSNIQEIEPRRQPVYAIQDYTVRPWLKINYLISWSMMLSTPIVE